MAVEPFSLLVLFAITIVVGYVGSLIFDKTRIPDIIWLLLFGLTVSAFGLIDRNLFVVISPFLAALALLVILFDAGLNMDFYQMIRGAPRGMLLAVIGITLDTMGVAAIGMFVMGMDLLHALLLGIIVSGTSSPIVVSIVSRLRIRPGIKTLVNLDSIFTDPLVIVLAIALLNVSVQANTPYTAASGIMGAFSIGAVVGMLLGIVWLFALDRLKGKPFDYMLTLAVLFLLYTVVESVKGSGAIAALFFGLVLGNGAAFSRMLKLEKRFTVNHLLLSFQSEVSFFIRSFFFVYLGLIAVVNAQLLIYGVAISAVLIVLRLVAVEIATVRMKLSGMEKAIMRIMVPRGLAAAVLAQLPATYGIQGAEVYANVAFVVILATVIYTTIATKLVSSRQSRTIIER